jgi:hypothetical protein
MTWKLDGAYILYLDSAKYNTHGTKKKKVKQPMKTIS